MKTIPFLLIILTGCSISFSNVSTEGKAEDVIDQEQSAEPNVSPTLSIPVKP